MSHIIFLFVCAGLIFPTLSQIQRRPQKLWPSSGPQPSRPFREFLVNYDLRRNSKGDDYALFLDNQNFNLHKDLESPTRDRCIYPDRTKCNLFFNRIEAQLDYWREDPMLHAFHCILHAAWSHLAFPSNIIAPQIISSGKLRLQLKGINSRANMRHFGFPTLSS